MQISPKLHNFDLLYKLWHNSLYNFRFVADLLLICCTTCCTRNPQQIEVLKLLICFGFVDDVQQVVQQINNKFRTNRKWFVQQVVQQVEVMELGFKRTTFKERTWSHRWPAVGTDSDARGRLDEDAVVNPRCGWTRLTGAAPRLAYRRTAVGLGHI